ncbi:Ig-like domain-containing protein [Parvimonas micra]|uniref:Ig-like domain-containing protein n=1 Tax=Parvimonas micra TaxID=33033 RepID=UPI002B4A5B22|nr:Ig-like domain-containing protein [Parvimonas micra]MEB3029567.1 Ig-like domain-containing protein [Parvimonas micra]
MGNLLKVISQKRQNSNKKLKWNMRKLSIGLISYLLGFSMLISSTTNVYAKVAWGTDGKVYMGDTDAEVNNAKKNIDVTKTLSADGKSIHWKIEFNKNRESWTTPWIFVFLPDAVKAPKEIKRYKDGVYHDTIKIEDFNGSHNRWHAEKGTQRFNQEWTNFVQRTGNDGSMAEQNAWKDQGRYSRLIYSKEASGKTAYTWEFDTEIIPGIDVDEAAILAGINAWNHGYPRVVGYGPHDTDGDGVSDVKENKLGTDPTKVDSKPSKDKVYPPVVNDGKKYVKKGTTVLSNEILDRVTVSRESGAITKETGSVPTELGEGTAKVKVKYSDGSEALADVPVVVYEAPVAPDKKTEVGDTEHLTAEEKKVVEDAIKAKNSKLPEGTTVTVDEKGKATITLPDGTTEEIPAEKLVEKKKPKEKTATPTDVKQDYDDNIGKAVITGKAPANSEVKLKNSNGDVVATTTAKPDGTFSIPIPNTVKDGDKVTVTATETGKTESEKSNEVVIDLKDPSAPTIEDVHVGDKEVTVNLSNDVEVGDKVRITFPNGNRVEVDITAEMIAAKKAKVGIPEGITLKKDEQVTVQLMDKAGNTSDVIVTKVKEKEFDKEKIANIEIKTPPTKTKYTEGEKFDPAGMVVTLTDENGKKVDVPAEKFAEYGITVPTENLTKDQTKVEVKVKNKKVEQPITVKEKEFDKEKIANIEIKTPPTKTKYTEGEKFDPAGMVVTLTDENGKKVDVPAEKFAEYGITVPTENLTKDQTKVEVKVKDKKVEQAITVKEKEFDKEKIANIEIKTPPTKTKYTEGEKFDPAGMVVTLTDENGKKVDVPAEKFAEYGITVPTENLTKDQTKVEVKVKDKKAEQPITVTPKINKTEKPVINNAKAGDKKITGTAEPGATLTVTTPEGVKTVVAGADGKWEITLGTPLAEGNVIKAVAKVNGKGASNEASITVGKAKPIADQVTPAVPKEKTPVENPTNLTKEEKETVKKKLEKANKGNFPSGTSIEIGSDGTATITYPDNSQDKIKGRNLVVKKKVKPIADQVTPAIPKEKTPVENPTNLAEKEKETVKKKLEEANKGNFPSGTSIEIGSDGTATITYPDNSQDKIKGSDLVVKKKVVSKKPTNKKLPKTSITGTGLSRVMIGLAGIGLSVLKKKKRED